MLEEVAEARSRMMLFRDYVSNYRHQNQLASSNQKLETTKMRNLMAEKALKQTEVNIHTKLMKENTRNSLMKNPKRN